MAQLQKQNRWKCAMFPQKQKLIKFHIPEPLLFVPFTEVLHFLSHSGHKLVPTLRSGQSVANLTFRKCFFQFCYRYLKIWYLLFVPHRTYTNREGDSLFLPFCTIGISMFQKSTVPYTLFLNTYLPQAYSPLERYGQIDRQTDKVLHPLFPTSFFSLSARGPTHRRNFTGLAEMWGGWPIELERSGCLP